MTELRRLRLALGLSQREFASRLGLSPESYRTWDAGRRVAPTEIVARARTLARGSQAQLLSLETLAKVLGVHQRTLQKAALDGRLAVSYETRPVFGHLVPRASLAAGRAFVRNYYRQTTKWNRPAPPPGLSTAPDDYDVRVDTVRRRLGLTQTKFAHEVGAAGKAIVYQWESRRRKPSPLLWQNILSLDRL